jgi:hypothetical protein
VLRRISLRCMWSALGFVIAAYAGSDDEADWMVSVEDTRGLAELSIPGMHNTGMVRAVPRDLEVPEPDDRGPARRGRPLLRRPPPGA